MSVFELMTFIQSYQSPLYAVYIDDDDEDDGMVCKPHLVDEYLRELRALTDIGAPPPIILQPPRTNNAYGSTEMVCLIIIHSCSY